MHASDSSDWLVFSMTCPSSVEQGLGRFSDISVELQLSPPATHKATSRGSIFTNPSDRHWKAVRKGVAPAFSPANLRRVPFAVASYA